MRTRFRASSLVVCVLSFLVAAASASSADDFDRPGWFVGVGGGVATDFLDELVQQETGGLVEIQPAGSLNARAGYRVWSWFAFEALYEGVYSLEIEALGVPVSSTDYHGIFGNFKFIIPTWRLQPYLGLGVGAQKGRLVGQGPLMGEFVDRWDLAIRAALGLDMYVTKRWVLNAELAPTIRFADYSNIPSQLTDQVSLIFSGGIQYRF